MLSVTRIDGTGCTYSNQNKRTSFKSKVVPNETMKIFLEGLADERMPLHEVRKIAKTLERILNDGENNIVEYTMNRYGNLSCSINGKKIKMDKKLSRRHNPDTSKNIKTLTNDEFNAIKNALNKLNADFNADDVTKNPEILVNLDKNIAEIEKALRQHTNELINQLRERIFNAK